MIVSTAELEGLRGEVVMVDGGFDPLHDGHIEYLRAAAAFGAPVLCNVSSDTYVRTKHPPLLPEEQRVQVIDAIRYVDYVHLSRDTTAAVLESLVPKMYIKGADWKGRLPDLESRLCRELGIEVVFVEAVRASSSKILDAFMAGPTDGAGLVDGETDFEAEVEQFEDAVLAQEPIDRERYDDQYFLSTWRDGANSYDLETRRRIEGRHPQLIKEVFDPQRVLDVGCGPGALMHLLSELGITADGVDFSSRAAALAPESVRDRITQAPITARTVPDRAYDLVICREVLEHLTVMEVRHAVEAICAATSRFAYVTSRFHGNPATLLEFTSEPEVDPTHITLLNKELLRCLFVLEGFRRRGDLEERLDWAHKGRVLVYERATDC